MQPFQVDFHAVVYGQQQDLRAIVAVVFEDEAFNGGIVPSGGFDGEADFIVAAEFALPDVLALNGFVLHAGGELILQQEAADAFGFGLAGAGGEDDGGLAGGHGGKEKIGFQVAFPIQRLPETGRLIFPTGRARSAAGCRAGE